MADNHETLYDSSGDEVITGTQYYLVPAFSREGGNVIYEFTDLNIHFPSQLCKLSQNAWTVSSYDRRVQGALIITANGRVGSPGPIWFKFEKFSDNVYVLLFDPSVGTLPKGYIGMLSGFDGRPALVCNPPLRLKIVKTSDVPQVKEVRLNKKAKIASVV
ncbi:uncharacterized protein LOC127798337 [Diospyros lotus]|uniref:uncharacterized protein LOC127798337 n=1 Tax=Diospyros lotus TaxID=55363 RepID=UPI0022543E67|nr:uncharacterized protein LOC127798337 [Diospyros lotus]